MEHWNLRQEKTLVFRTKIQETQDRKRKHKTKFLRRKEKGGPNPGGGKPRPGQKVPSQQVCGKPQCLA